jgi:Mg-chelatase subunit ChlD
MTVGLRASALLVVSLLVAPSIHAQRTARRVFVEAADQTGAAVIGLTADDFQVMENGVRRQVTRAVLGSGVMRIVLLVDSSGSMASMLPHFRAGLRAFLDNVPGDPEIALISTGGQFRLRVPPTTNRERLLSAAGSFAPDGGANAFVDALFEADTRLLKSAPDRWPVFVILTTDTVNRVDTPIFEFNRFVTDFTARGGSAHALVVRGLNGGVTTDLVRNLAQNTEGSADTVVITNGMAERMKLMAERVSRDERPLAHRYIVEYASDAKVEPSNVFVHVPRSGVTAISFMRRPF